MSEMSNSCSFSSKALENDNVHDVTVCTYVFEPGEFVHFRIRFHYALEVNVVTLFDVIWIKCLSHPQSHHRLIVYLQSPLVLHSTVGNQRVLSTAS